MEPLVRSADGLFSDLLGPFGRLPSSPFAAMRFGLRAIWSGKSEQQMFDCLSWLYDGFDIPQREAA